MRWQLDLHVPLALISAIALQSAAALWWASAVNTRLDMVEHVQSAAASQGERLARVETKVDALSATIGEIKGLLIPARQQPSPH